MRLSTYVLALAIVAGLAAATVRAGDWPKWLGPDGSGISNEKGLLQTWPEAGPKVLWRKPVGIGYSSPVVVGKNVYLFSLVNQKDSLTCFAADDGKEIWTKPSDAGYTREGKYPGTRATPTIEGDRIYTYGGMGDLTCRKLADGEQVWRTEVLKETGGGNITWGQASSPVIAGDLIYVQAGGVAAKNQPTRPIAVAVNTKDGTIAWKAEQTGLGGYAAVLPMDVPGGESGKTVKVLAVLAGDALVGMDAATGKTLWHFPWKTSYDVNAATPIYRNGMLFITSGYGHGCLMLRLNGVKAEKAWDKKAPHDKFAAPILDGDYLYVNSEGPLMCLHWPDGREEWTSDALGLDIGGSFTRFGEKLIALTERGQLVLALANKDGCEVLGKIKPFPGSSSDNWSTPVIANGRLYVKGPNELVCFDIVGK